MSIGSGKADAMAAPRLFTTFAGAQRLGILAEELRAWQLTRSGLSFPIQAQR
jgi:hypothetical protein